MLGLSKPWVDELEFMHWRCVFAGLSVVFYNAYLPLLSEAHPDVSCGIDINNIMTLISFAYVVDLVMFERLAESYFCASVLSQVHACVCVCVCVCARVRVCVYVCGVVRC